MKKEKLKDRLPKKWRIIISELTGFTITYVSYIVLGNRPCNTQAAKEIMEAANILAEKNTKKKKEFTRKLAEL